MQNRKIFHNIQEHALFLKKLHPELRSGQSLMLAINEISPKSYVKITGSQYDCFYEDRLEDICKAFLDGLLQN